jgi:hypothetical protein
MNNELDEAIEDYKRAVVDLKIAVEKLTKSNQDKLRAVKRLQPLLGDIIKKINVTN